MHNWLIAFLSFNSLRFICAMVYFFSSFFCLYIISTPSACILAVDLSNRFRNINNNEAVTITCFQWECSIFTRGHSWRLHRIFLASSSFDWNKWYFYLFTFNWNNTCNRSISFCLTMHPIELYFRFSWFFETNRAAFNSNSSEDKPFGRRVHIY